MGPIVEKRERRGDEGGAGETDTRELVREGARERRRERRERGREGSPARRDQARK